MQKSSDADYDAKLTPFGKATISDRYTLPGETFQDMFRRVANYFASNNEHAKRMYHYIASTWFMPATPVLSNGGTDRGLSISCFLSEAGDTMESLAEVQSENFWLASKGGGIGTYFGNIRSLGETIRNNGKSSGVIPFMKIHDSQTLAISQGNVRQSAMASYLPIHHPEIEEFIELRKHTGGDPNRRCLNLHHGIMIDDKFMEAVQYDLDYDLLSPKNKSVIKTVKARDLWIKILTTRLEHGEPYLVFSDTVNTHIPEYHKKDNLNIKLSNLCTEITLPTNEHRTAVCCLGSLNLETFDEWINQPNIIKDCVEFLDNVLQDFIDHAPASHAKAVYSANQERSIGLGVMGLHGYYQSKGWAWGFPQAYSFNKEYFHLLKSEVDAANRILCSERGACPDAQRHGVPKRFSNVIAIAPTASISIICGGATPGVEPVIANQFLHKTKAGSFTIKNKYLKRYLESIGKDTPEIWSSIATNEGSVQHLDFIPDKIKEVFQTAFEINQHDIIRQASVRQQFICQSQSINLFVPPSISKSALHELHFSAWKYNLKTLYYCRSRPPKGAEKPSEKVERKIIDECEDGVCSLTIIKTTSVIIKDKYETCESCQ